MTSTIKPINNINYNSDFLCTYRNYENENDCDLCYQIQLLQAFNMTKYDDFILGKNIEKAYAFLKENGEIKKIMGLLSKSNSQLEFLKALTKDFKDIYVFQLLFSYEYFDIFHKCLSKYLNHLLSDKGNTATIKTDENSTSSTRETNFFQELEETIMRD